MFFGRRGVYTKSSVGRVVVQFGEGEAFRPCLDVIVCEIPESVGDDIEVGRGARCGVLLCDVCLEMAGCEVEFTGCIALSAKIKSVVVECTVGDVFKGMHRMFGCDVSAKK